MAQRPLLKADRWVALLGVPTDEETLIRHYTLTQTELDLVQAKTAAYNQLGLAIQLCLIRHIGRCWQYEEMLPAPMVTTRSPGTSNSFSLPAISSKERR